MPREMKKTSLKGTTLVAHEGVKSLQAVEKLFLQGIKGTGIKGTVLFS
jgi:hypothetical protein